MKRAFACIVLVVITTVACEGQTPTNDTNFKLALPVHQGQLQWHADGFKIVQSSAKPNGQEIGIRGRNEAGNLTFLGFLFLVSGQTSLTGTRCLDGAIEPLKKSNSTLKILGTAEIATSKNLPVELIRYTGQGNDGKPVYSARGFVATGNICGDLELYSDTPINPEAPDIKENFPELSLRSWLRPAI